MTAKPTGGRPPFDRSGGGPRDGHGPPGRERKGPGRYDAPRGGDKPTRREGRPPWQRDDRPQGKREDYGDRPPRREGPSDRPPRREFSDRPPRREYSDRPPRRDYPDRPPWRENEPSGPPRREQYSDRPPRDDQDRESQFRRETHFEPGERPRRPSYRADVAGPAVIPPPEYKPEELAKTAEKITAACLEVHRQLGSALDVTIYQRALTLEMQSRALIFEREERVPVSYKGRQIDTRKVDFIVDGCLVELRSQPALTAEDSLRTGNYLKASGYRLTLLVNFGPPKIEVRSLTHGTKEE